ncbi:MAG: hypothetical protein M3N93_12790 [Acidobacteriota bacterium]|nr:hypothetical protein [Acidobacteriota bacterium]
MIKQIATSGVMVLAMMALTRIPAAAEIDLAGQWAGRYHEDWPERFGPGPDVADYTGLPLNDAARAKADGWEASVQTLQERQCIPHPFPYSLRGPATMRIWSETDPVSGHTIDWKMYGTFGRATHTVWMDGRPHPSENAPHTWEGFTTGWWDGDGLSTYTTHIKMGYLRRNGVPTSDLATVSEHWTRHGNTLTATVIVYDPVYLTEPYIRTSNWQLDPTLPPILPTPCEPVVEVARPKGAVPHYLPGQNPFLNEFPKMYNIPLEAARGGSETMYPEYRRKLRGGYVAPEKCTRYCCGGGPVGPGVLNCSSSDNRETH